MSSPAACMVPTSTSSGIEEGSTPKGQARHRPNVKDARCNSPQGLVPDSSERTPNPTRALQERAKASLSLYSSVQRLGIRSLKGGFLVASVQRNPQVPTGASQERVKASSAFVAAPQESHTPRNPFARAPAQPRTSF